jgi:hypothetical protein
MLSSYPDCFPDVHLRIKMLVPLGIGHLFLPEGIERCFLLVNGGKWVLVIRLRQDSLFNETTAMGRMMC